MPPEASEPPEDAMDYMRPRARGRRRAEPGCEAVLS